MMTIKRVFIGFFVFLAPSLWAEQFSVFDLDVFLKATFQEDRVLAADGDFNGDGFGDILTGGNFGTHRLLYGGDFPSSGDLLSVEQTEILLPYARDLPPFFADINGDTRDDLFIPLWDQSQPTSNITVYVLFGSTTTPSQIDLLSASDLIIHCPFTALPNLLHFAKGDYDGDGKEDVVLSGGNSSIESFLLLGKLVEGMRNFELDNGVSAIRFHGPGPVGPPVAMGDLNGDGLADFVGSDPEFSPNGRNHAGQVYVFLGTTTVPLSMERTIAEANITLQGPTPFAYLTCHAVGDMTGDGKADLILRNTPYSGFSLWEGGEILAAGSPVDLASGIAGYSPVAFPLGVPATGTQFIAKCGDFDGDKRDDLLTGAGVFLGVGLSSDLFQGIATWPSAVDYLGAEKYDVGDINGDGRVDLVLRPITGSNGDVGILYGYRPLDAPSLRVGGDSTPPRIVIDLSVEGDPSEMVVSGDFEETLNGQWIDFQPSLSITLTRTEGDKNVRVRFRNTFGRESSEAQLTVNLNAGSADLVTIDNVIDSQTRSVRVDCHVDSLTHVKATVHDQSGAVIAGVLDADLLAGVWPLEWDGKNDSGRSVGPGVYYMAIERNGTVEKRKLLVYR
jgi:hypothetical protein